MIKKAEELLKLIENSDKTEENRIAIKRMKEVISLLKDPQEKAKYIAAKKDKYLKKGK
jgi:hypothetical protein